MNYLEKDTDKVLSPQKVKDGMTFGTVITSSDEVIKIDGYNYDSVDKDTLEIGTGDNVINIYYTKRTDLSYKVNYLEKDTNKVLHDAKTVENQTFEAVVNPADEKIAIDGYNYVGADKEKLTIGTGENVLNLYYTKRTDLSYTVNYYWNGTTDEVAESKTVRDQTFDDEVTEFPEKDIPGCTPVSNDSKTIKIGTGTNEINFYYYKNVELEANSATLSYNGKAQSVSGFTGAPEDADFSAITVDATGTDAETYPAEFAKGTVGTVDVTEKYIVTAANNGQLVITPRAVTLTSETAGKTYDGTALEKPVVTVGGDGFVEGQVKEIKATGSVTNAGSVANTITFTPNKETFKEGNYAITKNEGTLTINKRSVLITSQSATKTYDGSALTRPAVTITGDGFVPGELAKAEATGSITYVGSTPNAIRYTTTGAFNAANYSIALSVGTLTVTEKPKPEPRRTFNLTINYVYQNGKRAAASYNRGGLKNGETFDIMSPVIAGYTASETVVSGTIYNRDIKVTVIYTADGVNLDDYGVPLGLGNITMNVGDCFE